MNRLQYPSFLCFSSLTALAADNPSGASNSAEQAHAHDGGTVASALPHGAYQWLFASICAGAVAGLLVFFLNRTRKTHGSDSKDLTSAQLGVLAAAIGTALGFGGAMLSRHDPILDLIVAVVTSVFVVQLGETLRSHHLSKRMQSLERALESDATFDRLDHQLNDLGKLNALLRQHKNARPLFDEFLAEAYNTLGDSLDALATGTMHVDHPARELTFNKDCLQHLAQKAVWAVSFQDGTFWDEPEGKDFLALHEEKIRAGVTVYRIFLLTNKELIEQKPIIEFQMARKINCRILLLESPSGKEIQPEDFVVYDDIFVRAAQLVEEGPTTTLKRAVLTCDPRKVRHYLHKRNDLKTRSEPAEDVFARMAASGISNKPFASAASTLLPSASSSPQIPVEVNPRGANGG